MTWRLRLFTCSHHYNNLENILYNYNSLATYDDSIIYNTAVVGFIYNNDNERAYTSKIWHLQLNISKHMIIDFNWKEQRNKRDQLNSS